MAKGIIYTMTTAVSGVMKIGKTETRNYQERMRVLEANGYHNVAGMRRFFAIEVEDYGDKERLLHEIFSTHRIGNSELFALDQDLTRQLLLSFDGKVVYPEKADKERVFDAITKVRKQGKLFSFYKKGLKHGDIVQFVSDDTITAVVTGEREVEYQGQTWRLSPLTYKIFEEKGQLTKSGAYQGANYWQYAGKRVKDLPDIGDE